MNKIEKNGKSPHKIRKSKTIKIWRHHWITILFSYRNKTLSMGIQDRIAFKRRIRKCPNDLYQKIHKFFIGTKDDSLLL